MSKKDQEPAKEVVDEGDLTQPQWIRKQIDKIPKDDPTKAEGLIREISEIIESLPQDQKEKKVLQYSLKGVALLGLSKELQHLMKSHGLEREGLVLVNEYLTTKPDLAEYLVETTHGRLTESMKMIKRKLGPKLEVYGELIHKGYDPNDSRVKKLVETASSRRELTRIIKSKDKLRDLEFDAEERKEILDIVKADQSRRGGNKKKENEDMKERVEKAKELMNQAKKMASENVECNRKDLNEKIQEIKKLVDLPSDWNKLDKESPDDMLKKLGNEITKLGEFHESSSSYDSVEEIVANASGGLALKGIYLSNSEPTKTSQVNVIKSPFHLFKVDSWNAQSPYETGFRQFSEGSAAARFSREVESSGFTHADTVSGFFGVFGGETSVSFGSHSSHESERSSKETTTSVSATNFCRSAMKCFAIPRNCLHPTEQVCDVALSITERLKGKNEQKEEIRRFFAIYGSHVPYGVHQLGGLFFTMSTATSQTEMETSKLMHMNANKLNSKVSAGFFGGSWGVGASDQHQQESSKGSSEGKSDEHESIHYTFSVKSIGPHSDNPACFKRTLSQNNATWAILDRGDTSINVPVWELLRDQGKKFNVIANLMEETWKEDEEMKKYQTEIKKTMDGLFIMVTSGCSVSYPLKGDVKNGGKVKFCNYMKTKKEALTKAKTFICQDPENNLCEIYKDASMFILLGWVTDTVIAYRETGSGHEIFYHVAYMKPENGLLEKVKLKTQGRLGSKSLH